jgi:hypothetical protein
MLNDDQIRDLAKIERMMDSGKLSFVVYDGERWSFEQELLEEFQIKSGQTVTHQILHHLQVENLAKMSTKKAIEKMTTKSIDK